MSFAIQFEGVSVGYRDDPVLKDLNLGILEGEFAAVIGPNGAGKTTLLRAVTGLLKPLSGSIRLFGVNLSSLTAAERARMVGVVPQDVSTPMSFTVEEVVMIGRTSALSRWKQPTEADMKIVQRAMVYTDVADMKDKVFSELSSGERQRAVIAMVLAQEPRIILLDEATSHLDINHRLEIMQIVERLNRDENVTVLMVSHDLNLSAEFCSRLVLVDQGHIKSDGKPVEVLKEKTLREVYRCNVNVQQNAATGSIHVVPAPRLGGERDGQGIKLHVVCGGGSGEDVLRRLNLCGYDVTCGVLNEKDTDAEVASALNIETALEKPFSPISRAALEKARDLQKRADAVIMCGVAFGTGNMANLGLVEEAMNDGKQVFLMEGISGRDYTPEKEAERKAGELVRNGAESWTGIADLLDVLPVKEQVNE